MENVKNRIIESAREQFVQYGFKKTSLDDIVKDVSISKGTIYNYFKNKEDLFKHVAEVEYANMFTYLQSSIAQGSDPKKIIILYVCKKVQYMKDFFSKRGSNFVILKELKEIYKQLEPDDYKEIAILREILGEFERLKIIKLNDNEETASLIQQIIEQFELRWTQMESQKAESEIKALFGLLFRGMRA